MNSNNNDWKTVPSAAPRFGRGASASDHAPSAFGRGAAAADAPMRPAFGRGGPRDAPSAFGRGVPNERALARQAESARIAEEQRRKQEAEAAAARKEADALNFASAAAYPTLGGGAGAATAAGVPKPKTTMNYKRTVEEMVERQKELEAEEAVAEASNWWDVPGPARNAPSRYIRQRNTEELDDDFLSVDEDEEQEDAGEFNAEIVSDRRRGDKGVW